jgi:hypothetical protein
MRSRMLAALAGLALVGAVNPSAIQGQLEGVGQAVAPATAQMAGGLSSENMEYVATIPIDSPGVSAKVRDVDGERLLFVSGVKGLTIYDIDDPARPDPVGHLPLPHSQNEDVQVSEDGTRVIIAADGGLPAPNQVTRGLHIIDTTDPSAPQWAAWLDNAGGGTNHTAACADAACDWIYGNRGAIYHVTTDEEGEVTITVLDRSWFDHDGERLVNGSHALNRSVHPDPETGEPVSILISDSTPRLVMDVTDPANPVLLAMSDPADHEGDGLLQHNNLRPNAADWRPRSADDGDADETTRRGPNVGLPDRAAERARQRLGEPDGDSGGEPATDPFGGELRPGELVIGNSESNLRPQCGGNAGGLTTFSIVDFDEGATMEKLHEFRPTNGDWVISGDPAVNALGCSGHWFDIRDGDNLIAASWYEHGIKVIEVLPDYSMRQIGFFQPVATEAGAAHWVVDDDGTEYIFSVDYARGIDIVRFHRDAPEATNAQLAEAWAVASSRVGAFSAAERMVCRLEY